MTSARGPSEDAEASFASAPEAPRPRSQRRGRRPAARLRSQPGGAARSTGAVAASAPPNQRRRRPDFAFLSSSSFKRTNPSGRPMRARPILEYHCPHDAGRNKSAAPLSRRDDARSRQAGRRSPFMPGRKAARASRTISTRCVSACRASRRSPIGSTATPRAAWCSDDIIRRWRNWGSLFKQGKIAKTYWAIVAGAPEGERGSIDLPLGRLDDKRGWWMKVDPNGQPALTLWRVKGRGIWRGAPIAWLELEPRTGRTHQLRVHCASQGWPILGDAIYGDARRRAAATAGAQGRRAAHEGEAADRGRGPGARHMLEALAACGFAGRGAGGRVGAVGDRGYAHPAPPIVRRSRL